MDRVLDELVALERAALDRWIQFDPEGYLRIQAPDLTYFDPFTEHRIDGLEGIRAWLAPMKHTSPPFTAPRYEIIRPAVQHQGELAVLTFNLVNYGRLPGARESVLARWNSTEVYRRQGTTWQIIHSHWSFIQPELK